MSTAQQEAPSFDPATGREMAPDGSYKIRKVLFPLELPNGGYFDEEGRSHAQVELSPTTGEEEDILMNENLAEQNEQLISVLSNCLRRMGDYSLPAFEDRSKEDKELAVKLINGISINDGTFLLVQLRRISLGVDGDRHKFQHKCPQCGSNAKEFTAVADLSDLDVRPFPCDGKPISFTLPQSKKVVRFRNLVMADSARLVKMVREHEEALASMALFLRIVDIDGKKVASYRDLKRLSTIDREALRGIMNESEGGLDLTLTVPCPKGHEDFILLQPGVSFFLPSFKATGPTQRRA